MSPIASIPAAFALSTPTPSVALDPDSAGQSASIMSQHLAGTGGFVFVAVAIISVAGYFYHRRGTANNPRKNTTWATFSNLLSSVRLRGSGTTAANGSGWPPDVEGGFEQHVSMVYARFFHPTFWNLVECHPATTSAPAIIVEDEASEIPASEPKPYGMNSYLDMDDDDGDGDEDGDKKANANGEREKAGQDGKPRIAKVPPYDTSSMTHVRFKSAIIGATDRPGGAFLCVPGKYQDGSSDTSSEMSSSSELDMASAYDGILAEYGIDLGCSPCDGVLEAPPRTPDGTFGTSPGSEDAPELAYLNDSQEFTCSSNDGIRTMPQTSSSRTTCDSEMGISCSPYDGIANNSHPDIKCLPCDETPTTRMRSFPSTRRYGMADMEDLAQNLEYSIPEEGLGLGLVRTIGRRSALCDLSDFDDTDSEADSATSYGHLEPADTVNDDAISSNCDVSVHDNCDGIHEHWSDGDAFAPPHEGRALMQKILEELRDTDMDYTSRDLSEDSDSEYSEDDIIDDDEGCVSQLAPTWCLDRQGRISLEWTSSTPRTDSDVSIGGSIYPPTPPTRTSMLVLSPPCVYIPSLAPTAWFDQEVQVVVPTWSSSPAWSPSEQYVRRHKRRGFPMDCGPSWLPY